MARKNAGDTVKAGFYWSPKGWEIVTMAEDAERLPGRPGESYYEVPTLAMLLAAPVMGALFVVFLPFIGIAIVLQYAARGSANAVRNSLKPVHEPLPVEALPRATESRPSADETRKDQDPDRRS